MNKDGNSCDCGDGFPSLPTPNAKEYNFENFTEGMFEEGGMLELEGNRVAIQSQEGNAKMMKRKTANSAPISSKNHELPGGLGDLGQFSAKPL